MSKANKKKEESTKKGWKKLPKPLRITLKSIIWITASIVTLCVLMLCLVVWVLTPQRLTPIVEDIANDMLTDASVSIGKTELTVWETFPFASIEIDSLQIQSSALQKYDSIPDYADSLLFARKLRAEINLAKIAKMDFDIKDITIVEPKINVVSLNDSVSNILIFPPSESDTTKSGMIMPEVILRKLNIAENKGIRYTDLKSNISVTLNSDTLQLSYCEKDKSYDMNFSGNVFANMPDYGISQPIPYLFKGNIKWNSLNPYLCVLKDFNAEVAKIPVKINTECSFGNNPRVKYLGMKIGPVKYEELASQIPEQYLNGIKDLRSDLQMQIYAKLDKPFRIGIDQQPSFHATILIPESFVQPGKNPNYRIDKMNLAAQIAYNGDKPNKTTVTLKNLLLDGFGIKISGSGSATNILSDPRISGKINGGINFAKVLKLIPKELPMSISGNMDMATTFKFALSNLNVKTFHKVQVNGEVNFNDIAYIVPQKETMAYLSNAKIKFGTDAKFLNPQNEIRNMLMASVSVDSLTTAMPGLKMTLCGASAGAGSVGNTADLIDSTKITPIGAKIKLRKLNFLSTADSVRLRLRNMESNGSIRRGSEPKSKPRFDFDINVGRIRFTDKTTSLNLREGTIKLSAHERKRKGYARFKQYIDSMCGIHPELSRDSVIAMIRASRKHKQIEYAKDEYIDLGVDNKLKKLLWNWDFEGLLHAKRGAMFTPYFPLRNVLKNVDMQFNLDTFNIQNITYRAGKSDMSIKGQVRNIRSTLLGGKRRALTLDMDISSDTLDANQLIATMYKGQAFSNDSLAKAAFNIAAIDDSDEAKMQDAVTSTQADSVAKKAIIIPKNIAVDLKIRNKNAKYAELNISDLRSDLMINKGVLSLRNLSGKAYDGMLRLDLVYASADKKDIGAGLFLELDDIQVGRFLNLMPGLDTIMPMLKGVDGVINAKLAASTKIDSLMNIITPTTNAALHIDGKDLVLLDSETFRKISKILLFKNKKKNMVDSISVEVAAYDSRIDVYPFILSMDRYKFGLTGHNDFNMNYKYHVSILKSPLPFKFGVNISGNMDDMKIRLGKAKLKEKEVARTTLITDSSKVNLFRQMNQMFRKGAEAALRSSDIGLYNEQEKRRLRGKRTDIEEEGLSSQDSINLINEGVIEQPDSISTTVEKTDKKGIFSKRKNKKKDNNRTKSEAIKPDEQ